MRSSLKILFYLRKNRLNKDGKASIMIRLTINSEMSQFAAKLDVEPELWDAKCGRVDGKTAYANRLNATLDNIKAALINHHNEIEKFDTVVTAEKVRNAFLGVESRHRTLLDLFNKHNEDVKKLVGVNKTAATLQKYQVTCKRLENFFKHQYNLSDISLKEINHMFITDFETYLRTICNCSANTTAKFMQFFKRIVIIARNNGWILTDPFANYKIRIAKVDRGYLTEQEIETIMQKEFGAKRLEQVRDIFVFSCFSGLAYIDVKNLREEHIRTSFDGNLWIMTKRHKTNVQANIPLLDVAKSILEKYLGKLPKGQLLPVLSNQKMNSYLKEIGDACGIDKRLTFHLSRHSFATLTLSKGVSIESVSKMLGHTNIKTTQIYAKITDNKIGHDMAAFADKVKDLNFGKQPQQTESGIDGRFDILSLPEKMALFSLPPTLAYDSEREKRLSVIWHNLSDEEKATLWKNAFESKKAFAFRASSVKRKSVINQ